MASGFSRITQKITSTSIKFLDPKNPVEKYFGKYWGYNLTSENNENVSYYLFNPDFVKKIQKATEELNNMCLRCTDIAIKDDNILGKFGIPTWMWPHIKKSWSDWHKGEKNTISGRFDLASNGNELKLIEYNADSAGTIVEAALVQDKWALSSGCNIGRSSGENLQQLIATECKAAYSGFVHIMIDSDPEEIIISHLMQQIFNKIGIKTKTIVGADFESGGDGKFYDHNGNKISQVWKTWSWDTIISNYEGKRTSNQVKICDILLDPDIMIMEPLWKTVTSNKAILPMLWELYPNHEYLLRTEWSIGEYFQNKPYVKKPIVGRCGQNVEIFGEGGSKIAKKAGKFGNRDSIYQEVFKIIPHSGYYPIIGSWIIGYEYGGFGIREDKKRITEYNSPFACCRISE